MSLVSHELPADVSRYLSCICTHTPKIIGFLFLEIIFVGVLLQLRWTVRLKIHDNSSVITILFSVSHLFLSYHHISFHLIISPHSLILSHLIPISIFNSANRQIKRFNYHHIYIFSFSRLFFSSPLFSSLSIHISIHPTIQTNICRGPSNPPNRRCHLNNGHESKIRIFSKIRLESVCICCLQKYGTLAE